MAVKGFPFERKYLLAHGVGWIGDNWAELRILFNVFINEFSLYTRKKKVVQMCHNVTHSDNSLVILEEILSVTCLSPACL